jgi:hypothetical protein
MFGLLYSQAARCWKYSAGAWEYMSFCISLMWVMRSLPSSVDF